MKREIFGRKKQGVYDRVKAEHESFKCKMLALDTADVYDCCNKIRFYECIYEYFQYGEALTEKNLDACYKETNLISALWELYIKDESLKADTWDDVEGILQALAQHQGRCAYPADGLDMGAGARTMPVYTGDLCV